MRDILINHWIDVVFASITALLSGVTTSIHRKFKKQKEEQGAIKEAVLAMLHDRLFQACNHYIGLGKIPISDAEQIMDNVEILYNAYHKLGGNGTGTELYRRFKDLPIK